MQSGTFPVIYKLHNSGSPDALRLGPILERARQASDLTFNADIRPNREQQKMFNLQLQVHVVSVLSKYCTAFEYCKKTPKLQHIPHHKMPAGRITKVYPLRATTIDESTITAQPKVLQNAYVEQLHMEHKNLEDQGVPSYNDQYTNAKFRAAQAVRSDDVNNFTRLRVWQLGFGLFHLCLNLIWALLHVHRGSITQLGSLSHLFATMDKTRLGAQHPDYHTLLAALTQILHGIILNAWRRDCGFPSLAAFAASKPTAEQLLAKAQEILLEHAVPMQDSNAEENLDENSSLKDSSADVARQNLLLLTHDLLYVVELVRAISDGDWGRIEDILGNLAMMFRGAGSNNYCAEILHFVHNLRKVWTPEFS